ncbi:hypothetical protein NC653_007359 [Populus alba x Populus x berolinensis]|uniref:Peptidase A1 domain-containing protein n=1 Tax=Populus alba x Populus x berolinensis TaxID=444605 RepID=A0AAD6RH66_9ROSI|nr:hypothetical protein NC653_007359 [Populus alba x Populus x berolinensis]
MIIYKFGLLQEGMYWCIGWQNSGLQSRDGRNMTLLEDLVLSNKLVLYDLENQIVGWTEYNCEPKTIFPTLAFQASKCRMNGLELYI